MKTHIEYENPCLVAKIKLQLTENSIIKISDQVVRSNVKKGWANKVCSHYIFWPKKTLQG
jgi:hypothetical protein